MIQQPPRKMLNHVVPIYLGSDTPNLMGMYSSLFTAMKIQHLIPFPPQENFVHMDSTLQAALVRDYYNTMQLLKDLGALDGGVRLEDARISDRAINFVFSYA